MSDESPPPTLSRLRPKTHKPGRFTGDHLEYIPPSRGNVAPPADDMSHRRPDSNVKRSLESSSNPVGKKTKVTKSTLSLPSQVPATPTLPKFLKYIKQAEERYKDEIKTRGNNDDNPVWKATKEWALDELAFLPPDHEDRLKAIEEPLLWTAENDFADSDEETATPPKVQHPHPFVEIFLQNLTPDLANIIYGNFYNDYKDVYPNFLTRDPDGFVQRVHDLLKVRKEDHAWYMEVSKDLTQEGAGEDEGPNADAEFALATNFCDERKLPWQLLLRTVAPEDIPGWTDGDSADGDE